MYVPKSLDDFFGNGAQKQKFKRFLTDEKANAIILCAPSGSGKTTFCTLNFMDYNFYVLRPCYEQYSCRAEFEEYVTNTLRIANVSNLAQPKVLFLDDIDILLANDKHAMLFIHDTIINMTTNNIKIKVVITCTTSEEKKLGILRKKLPIIWLDYPSADECCRCAMSVLQNNASSTARNDSRVLEANVRSLVYIMQCNLQCILSNLPLFLDLELENQHQRYMNLNVLDMCLNVLQKPEQGIQDLITPLSTDPTLVSFILYDNLSKFIKKTYIYDCQLYRNGLRYVTNIFAEMSVVEANSYNTCDWTNIETINLIKCGSIRVFQNSLVKRDVHCDEEEKCQITYTTIPTRSAQHICNKRKLQHFSAVHDISVENTLFLCEVVFERHKMKSQSHKVSKVPDELSMYNSYVNNITSKQHCIKLQRCRRII